MQTFVNTKSLQINLKFTGFPLKATGQEKTMAPAGTNSLEAKHRHNNAGAMMEPKREAKGGGGEWG